MGAAVAIRFEAAALAFRAKAGARVKDDALALLRRVAAELGQDAPEYGAVHRFCGVVARPVAARQVEHQAAGDELLREIERLSMPVPPDVAAGRADIHG
ncbi:MAG: hypothetical protein AAGG09_06485 [Pseudomonadota bacterium]